MVGKLKILSCDGGGIRGLITAQLLVELEKELRQKDSTFTISNCFDFFAGTSTGSIIACGLANGMSAQDILNFYVEECEKNNTDEEKIFKQKSLLKKLGDIFKSNIKDIDISKPLFEADGLENVLRKKEVFPDSLLFKDLPKPTLITSYDTYNREAVIFVSRGKNTTFSPDEEEIYLEKYKTLPVWKVCRASCAAPIAFPGYILDDENYIAALENKTKLQQFPIKRTTKKLSQRLKVETTMLEPIKSIFISRPLA
jgi:patatin-like phospholipase/acyl hydrolase